MDLRKHPRDWKKNPPSLAKIVVLTALTLSALGLYLSRFGAETVPNVLFILGTIVAGVFVAAYLRRMGEY